VLYLDSEVFIDVPAYVIATVFGAVLCFWGVQLSRFISSVVFASILGYMTYSYSYAVFKSVALSIIFMLLAIVIGLVIGFIFFKVALSLSFGYTIASIILRDFIKSRETALLIVLTIIFAILIYVLSTYLLALLFVATGSSLIYRSLPVLGLQTIPSIVIVLIIAIAGLYNQIKRYI
jgi:hypothetical protein